ncbi:MAG: endonuclease Q family protein, partial [Candidatus Omnitrophica bacterium]|nr:endonuclease Q family protein [Candidatus Omnitrophota bacterium]
MFIADLHIHSKYSRATSKEMDLDHLVEWARLKGISLLGTADFTHHLWLQELKSKLKPAGNGLFSYQGVNFILA